MGEGDCFVALAALQSVSVFVESLMFESAPHAKKSGKVNFRVFSFALGRVQHAPSTGTVYPDDDSLESSLVSHELYL